MLLLELACMKRNDYSAKVQEQASTEQIWSVRQPTFSFGDTYLFTFQSSAVNSSVYIPKAKSCIF